MGKGKGCVCVRCRAKVRGILREDDGATTREPWFELAVPLSDLSGTVFHVCSFDGEF